MGKTHVSISDVPPMMSSSSRSSKSLIKSWGIISCKPCMKARDCSWTLVLVRYSTTASTYSFLLSSVTGISAPPGFNSTSTISPKRSSVDVNVSSKISVMSCSLKEVLKQGSLAEISRGTYNIQIKLR